MLCMLCLHSMVVISAIMQWLHNAGWTSLSVVAKKRKRQFVKFAMSKECVYLAPWENRTTSIVYFDLFIYLRLWDIESFKMYTFRCLQTEAMTSFWMFYCPFFEVCKYWVRPWLYPAVPDFLWNCYLLDKIVWKLPYFQSNFIASFVKISLHLNFSIFPTHSLLISREKLKFNFRRKTLMAFWKKDSLSSETISNSHIDFLSRLRLWNHNECY